MTPGQRYLNLLRIEYQDLIKAALKNIEYAHYMLEHYKYEPHQFSARIKDVGILLSDIAYYTKALENLGGAENEDKNLTDSKESESPTDRITCTTVL